MAIEQYKVEVTPLEKLNTYQSSAIDITDYVKQGGISSVIQQVDDGDFDIGVFTFDSVKLDLINDTGDIRTSGKFWDVESPSSIFKYKRDLAKIQITFLDNDGVETEQFNGFIDDTLTKSSLDTGIVSVTIIAEQGIFNKNAVTGGAVSSGMTVSQALKSILDRPKITSFLNYSDSNINLAIDPRIDDGTPFDNINYKAALDKLMLMSGSVLLVDSSSNIIIKDRTENSNTTHRFYNAGDPLGRANIINLAGYNNGVQRAFNLYKIDEIISRNDKLIAEFGLRGKEISVADIVTNEETRQSIADYYGVNFSFPKQEMQIVVETSVAKNVGLLDLCTIDYRQIVKAATNAAFSFPDNTPIVLNKRIISDKIGFKVIAKQINVINHTTTLKLREIGIAAGDSVTP